MAFSSFHLCVCAAAAAKSLQSCPTLCDPTDSSAPGSAVPGILQARTLEWGASAFYVCVCSLVQSSLTLWVLLCLSNNTDNCVPGLLWEIKERKIQAQSRFSLNVILSSSYTLLRNWRNSSWGEVKSLACISVIKRDIFFCCLNHYFESKLILTGLITV